MAILLVTLPSKEMKAVDTTVLAIGPIGRISVFALYLDFSATPAGSEHLLAVELASRSKCLCPPCRS